MFGQPIRILQVDSGGMFERTEGNELRCSVLLPLHALQFHYTCNAKRRGSFFIEGLKLLLVLTYRVFNFLKNNTRMGYILGTFT